MKKKEYKKPVVTEIEMTGQNIIATSGIKYTQESADADSEVLSTGRRGDWGDMWNK